MDVNQKGFGKIWERKKSGSQIFRLRRPFFRRQDTENR